MDELGLNSEMDVLADGARYGALKHFVSAEIKGAELLRLRRDEL